MLLEKYSNFFLEKSMHIKIVVVLDKRIEFWSYIDLHPFSAIVYTRNCGFTLRHNAIVVYVVRQQTIFWTPLIKTEPLYGSLFGFFFGNGKGKFVIWEGKHYNLN